MTPPRPLQPRHVRYSVRHQARLDASTLAKLEELRATCHRKYQLRLDEATSRQLEALTHTFDRPAAEVIRQLILQAKLEDFPTSWQIAAQEHRPPCNPRR